MGHTTRKYLRSKGLRVPHLIKKWGYVLGHILVEGGMLP